MATLTHPGIRGETGFVHSLMQGRIRWIAAAEIAAMSLLVLSYIWLWPKAFPGAFALCAALYFGIGIVGHRRRGESLQSIGVRVDNWWPAMRNASIVVVIAVSAALTTGALLDSWHFPTWKAAIGTLAITIIWATAQQYGLLCVFYRRLHEMFGNVGLAAVGAALFFAIFHVPNGFLMAVTLVAGTAACVLYRYQPNLFVIGIAHALISFSLYYSLPFSVTAQLRVGPSYYKKIRTAALLDMNKNSYHLHGHAVAVVVGCRDASSESETCHSSTARNLLSCNGAERGCRAGD